MHGAKLNHNLPAGMFEWKCHKRDDGNLEIQVSYKSSKLPDDSSEYFLEVNFSSAFVSNIKIPVVFRSNIRGGM
jgi:hypothetical protein